MKLEEIYAAIARRNEAKKAGQDGKAEEIRLHLSKNGVSLSDRDGVTEWAFVEQSVREHEESYITNCLIKPRGAEHIIRHDNNRGYSIHLDRYAIIPLEEYEKLLLSATKSSQDA
jgi:hypothetical protein